MTRLAAAAGLVVGLCMVGCSSSQRVDSSQAAVTTIEPATLSTAVSPATTIADLDAAIRQITADWYGNADIGGVVAVVGTPDGSVRVVAAGQAAPGVGAPSDDVMRTGSITKTFTATLAVRLARQGLIDLDAPVADQLPDLGLGLEVTIRGLLNHTSGITDPDPTELITRFRADPAHRFNVAELADLAVPPSPGGVGEFAYANANYHVVGMLIEAVTGRELADVLRSEIFDVVGLDHTYLVGFEPVSEAVVPGNVDLDGDGTEDSLAGVPYLAVDSYGWAAGAIATSPADLVAFVRALFDGTLLDDDGIAELTDRTHHGQRPLGLINIATDTWGHNGGAPGYQAAYMHDAARGVTAALFTNCPTCADANPDLWEPVHELLIAAAP
jgi:D-alanyl-D-alanine carboxypeptidase